MAGNDLSADYLRALTKRLPTDIVKELADGLECTRQRLRDQGLAEAAATAAAIAEFGSPDQIARAFAQDSPARRTARTLIATGPVIGACWAAVLLTGHAWTWPIPMAWRIAAGLILLATIATLFLAATSGSYRRIRTLALIGCGGLAVVDATMLGAITLAPATTWPLLLAVPASAIRLVANGRTLLAHRLG